MTSEKTNKEILSIIDEHLNKDEAIKMFEKLEKVDGNKSFKDSIKNLLKLLNK